MRHPRLLVVFSLLVIFGDRFGCTAAPTITEAAMQERGVSHVAGIVSGVGVWLAGRPIRHIERVSRP